METALVPYRQPLLFQPVERAAAFSFAAIVDQTRAVWFPELSSCEIEVRVTGLSSLASVWPNRMGYERHIVVFHPVLNRADVPVEVVRFIAKHELSHLVHPGEGHSPAFWERELQAGPERFAVWHWLHENLDGPVRNGRLGTVVLKTWRRRVPASFTPYTPHLPFDDVPWTVLCPEGGGQLRFLPEWSAAPAPLAEERPRPLTLHGV